MGRGEVVTGTPSYLHTDLNKLAKIKVMSAQRILQFTNIKDKNKQQLSHKINQEKWVRIVSSIYLLTVFELHIITISPLVQQLAKNWLWFKLSLKKQNKTNKTPTPYKIGGWASVSFPACSSLIFGGILGKVKGKRNYSGVKIKYSGK